jgi:hypothetical protein
MRSRRRGVALGVVAAAVLGALTLAGVAVWWHGGLGSLVGRELCVVTDGDRTLTLTPDQAQHAATISAVAARGGLPPRAVVVALATAMQESKLHNLPAGDRDSAGLFQQRPSQGWGNYQQVTDPARAAGAFYRHLTAVPGWQRLRITDAAQAVQRSAFPDAYQQHAEESRMLASALTGRSQASFTCTIRAEAATAQSEQPNGLTPRAERLRTAMENAFGPLSLGGFAPGGVDRPGASTHEQGLAIDVFFRPYRDPEQKRAGWALAHWLVAHADRLGVAVVIYDDRIWSARRSPEGWRSYTSPFGDPTNAVERHLDHVHVEVD